MRNEDVTLTILALVPGADELLLWLTDVTNFTATRDLTQLAWEFAKGVTGLHDIAIGAPLLLEYLPTIISEWKKESRGGGTS
jgi:hypothetical protein